VLKRSGRDQSGKHLNKSTLKRLQGVWGWGKVAKTMYTHVSKCKNNKIKGEKKT
jgi:hypothetical protein